MFVWKCRCWVVFGHVCGVVAPSIASFLTGLISPFLDSYHFYKLSIHKLSFIILLIIANWIESQVSLPSQIHTKRMSQLLKSHKNRIRIIGPTVTFFNRTVFEILWLSLYPEWVAHERKVFLILGYLRSSIVTQGHMRQKRSS